VALVHSAVIVGASSGVGRALCRRLARERVDLVIASRDVRDLDPTCSDLELRYGIRCRSLAVDIAAPDFDAAALLDGCEERIGRIDTLLVPAGGAVDSDQGPNAEALDAVVGPNFTGPAKLAATFGGRFAERGGGAVVLFSSIAAVAPRTQNPAYSAAKAALETYARGLGHALWRNGVGIWVVALGYVDTPQTFGLRLLFPKKSPDAVADYVVKQLIQKPEWSGKRYYPGFWWWVTACLRLLPWFLYRRLRF
jgi:NAD(P)-dependent dehydrogenase (short-subunit alcohol dehydrogenase family)